MDRAQLLQHFDTLADTPEAVAKLRTFVLQLACSGKLVVQNPEEEPATAALARFRTKRTAKGGRVTDEVSSIGVEAGQSLYVPSSWAITTVREVCQLATGATPSKSRPEYFGGNIRWLVSGDIHKREIFDCDGRITERGLENSNCKILDPGSVLIALNGQGKTRATVAVLRVPAACNQSLVAMKPIATECLTPEYLYWNLRSRYFDIRDITGQKQRRGLNMGLVGDLILAIPPIGEQKRIFARVAELFALCDEMEARQTAARECRARLVHSAFNHLTVAPSPKDFRRHAAFVLREFPHLSATPDAIPALRQAILALAVRGGLVDRIISDGAGSDVLEEAGVTEASPDGVPMLPDHWVWAHLGSITTLMDSGWSPACLSEPAKDGAWGVLRTTAVQTLEYQEWQNKALPSNLEPRPEHEVMSGDILFTRAGPMNRVGILCVARPTRRKLMISDKIIRFHLVPGIDPDFAALALNAGYSNTVIKGLKSGMAASQVNISQPKLRSVPIPIPPLAEQRRIVAKVEDLMRWCDQLEAQLTAAQTAATHLLDTLVAELTSVQKGERDET